MLLIPLYLKFVIREEIEPGNRKESSEILMTSFYFRGFLGLNVFWALLVFQTWYNKLFAIYKIVAHSIMHSSYHLFT